MIVWTPQQGLARSLVATLLMVVLTFGLAQNRLVIAFPLDPTSLDPQWHVGQQRSAIYPLLYDRLIKFDTDGSIVGELATDWTVSDDGLLVMFNLREGHVFHDGTPVDAEAVRASYDRFFDPDMPFTEAAPLAAIEEIVVTGTHQLEFRLSRPDAFILNKMIYETNSIISPTAALGSGESWLDNLESFANAPVGSGPFRFVSWDRGTRIVLEKNEEHWQAGESNIDAIEFRIIPEATSRSIALELREVDYASTLTPQDALNFVDRPGFTLHTFPLTQVISFMFNHSREDWQDVRVRRALAHAIDREVIIDVLVQGFAVEARSVLPAGIFPSTPQDAIEFDPERARQLLREAGVENSLSATFWVPTGSIPGARQIGEAVGAMLEDVGVDVDVQLMEHDTWRLTLRAGPEQATFDISLFTWSHGTGEADRGLTQNYRTANWAPECCNWHYYSNPEVDELLDTARTLLTDVEREPYYLDVQRILWEEVAMLPLFQTTSLEASSDRLTGFSMLAGGSWELRRANLEPR